MFQLTKMPVPSLPSISNMPNKPLILNVAELIGAKRPPIEEDYIDDNSNDSFSYTGSPWDEFLDKDNFYDTDHNIFESESDRDSLHQD